MKKSLLLFLIIGNLVMSLFAIIYVLKNDNSRIAYVDIQKVFQNFKGKKEMEASFIQYENNAKAELDSLRISLKELDNQRLVLKKQYEMEQALSTQSDKLNDAVWKQINQYVLEYGKENSFDYILGANSTGSLMYAKETNDITISVTEYINRKYEGY